jgi:ribosomal subunit interface protein
MQLPLQVTFRNMDPSPAVEARARELAQRLDRFSSHIMSCHVIIEEPHKHQHQGKIYEVRVDLTVPQNELVVSREHPERHTHEDVYVALRDAFDAARSQLEKYERRHRQDVKHHEPNPQGWVSELYPAEDFGRIATTDGRSIYFHRNSVLGMDLEHLATGMEVQFVEERGDQGPQASTVKVLSRNPPHV